MQDTCFEENLPRRLFQTSNFLQNVPHSETLTQGHANASPLKLKRLVKNAAYGDYEQQMNACQPFTMSAVLPWR